MRKHPKGSTDPDKYLIVPTKNLDSLIERFRIRVVHILRIDVEGAKVEVLKGGKKALGIVKEALIEAHSPALKENVLLFLAYHRLKKGHLRSLFLLLNKIATGGIESKFY